jgi:hypothetical protein
MKRKIKQNADSGVRTGKMTGLSRLVFYTGIVLILVICSECDTEGTEDDGKLASKEFCDCYKKNTEDECFEQLKDDYSNYESDVFIEAFNDANTCGFELKKVQYEVGNALNTEFGIIKIVE